MSQEWLGVLNCETWRKWNCLRWTISICEKLCGKVWGKLCGAMCQQNFESKSWDVVHTHSTYVEYVQISLPIKHSMKLISKKICVARFVLVKERGSVGATVKGSYARCTNAKALSWYSICLSIATSTTCQNTQKPLCCELLWNFEYAYLVFVSLTTMLHRCCT